MSLEQQLSFQDRQIELVKKELAGVSSLVEQGLAVAPREMALERSVLELQGDRLAAETALLRARQETSRTEISILELRNRYTTEAAEALRDAETALNETGTRTDTAVQLLYESETLAPLLRAGAARVEPSYAIVRPDGDGTVELAATESTPVRPGDTIKVELPLPSFAAPPPAAAAPAPAALAARRLSPPRAKRCPCLRSTRRPDPPAAAPRRRARRAVYPGHPARGRPSAQVVQRGYLIDIARLAAAR